MHSRILTVIPARGGSKGIPRKNLQLFRGKTLVHQAVSVARQSTLDDELIYVSTDDEEIIDECRRIGVQIIYRPFALAQDDTLIVDVLQHALSTVRGMDAACLLQPTNPLRTRHIVNECLQVFGNERADSVACRVDVGERHPGRMSHADGDPVWEELTGHRRQDLPTVYLRDGSCYIFDCELIKQGRLFGDRHSWVEVPRHSGWNVDDPWDLSICEALAKWRDDDENHC